jgi:hypothetical protein
MAEWSALEATNDEVDLVGIIVTTGISYEK